MSYRKDDQSVTRDHVTYVPTGILQASYAWHTPPGMN
jgi:hypothetical protein